MKFQLSILLFAILPLCFGLTKHDNHNQEKYTILQTDTVSIKNVKYILTVYRNDTSAYFTVQKKDGKRFKIILKDLDYWTNNSDIGFYDANNDGFLDVCWLKKWQSHCYLFNPKIDNFIEVGEYYEVDTLKVKNSIVLYQNKFPLLFQLGGAKSLSVAKCGDDTLIDEVNSELFIINENYQKLSFASLDNFTTFDSKYFDTLTCGSQIMTCYVPPYFGKYGPDNIWNSGKLVDSFMVVHNNSFLSGDTYHLDSNFIADYWINHYTKYLKYGQIFKVRRDKPLLYYK